MSKLPDLKKGDLLRLKGKRVGRIVVFRSEALPPHWFLRNATSQRDDAWYAGSYLNEIVTRVHRPINGEMVQIWPEVVE